MIMQIDPFTRNIEQQNSIQGIYNKFLEDEQILKAIHKLHKTKAQLELSKYHLIEIEILYKERILNINKANENIRKLQKQFKNINEQNQLIKKEFEQLQNQEIKLKKQRFKYFSEVQYLQNKLRFSLENIENMNPNTRDPLKNLIDIKLYNEEANDKIVIRRQQLTLQKSQLEKIQKQRIQLQQKYSKFIKPVRYSKQSQSKIQASRQQVKEYSNYNYR